MQFEMFAWPVVAIVALLLFREPIANFIATLGKIKVAMGDTIIEIDRETTKSIVSDMLSEIDQLLDGITPEQKSLAKKIF